MPICSSNVGLCNEDQRSKQSLQSSTDFRAESVVKKGEVERDCESVKLVVVDKEDDLSWWQY